MTSNDSSRRNARQAMRIRVSLVAAVMLTITMTGATQARSLEEICSSRTQGFTDDVKCYFTAPVRWDGGDWIYFGGVVAAVGLAHHYDEDVRNHFVTDPTI